MATKKPKHTKALICMLMFSLLLITACSNDVKPIPANTDNTTKTDSTQNTTPTEKKDPTPEVKVIETSSPKDDLIEFTNPGKTPALLDRDQFANEKTRGALYQSYKIYSGSSYSNETDEQDLADDNFKKYFFFDSGKFKSGQYQGWKLITMSERCEGMCLRDYIYRFAYNPENGEKVLLTNNSSNEGVDDYLMTLFTSKDSSTTIASLKAPKEIKIPNTDQVLTLGEEGEDVRMTSYGDLNDGLNYIPGKIAFTDPVVGNVYFDNDDYGCVTVVKPDGTTNIYSYDNGFFTGAKKTLKLNDGTSTPLTDKYIDNHGGCGVRGNCYVAIKVNEQNLKKVGTASNGVEVFAIKNAKQNIKDSENASPEEFLTWNVYEQNQYAAGSEMVGKDGKTFTVPKVTFDEFLKQNAVIFTKDPFGRWQAFVHDTFKIPAECGKPVIYLYPTKETTVNVKVSIDRMTESIPPYPTDGWTVKASPNGKLVNLTDNQVYPYLFWEGQSDKGLNVRQGFVIEKTEVKSFLKTSLAKMGLNEQESKDFIEFWLPRMTDGKEKYVLISFIGTRDFNKIAPLAINPSPDTLIRVFMYYQPLARKISIEPQQLNSIPRRGFTVIEWGGTSNENWKNVSN